MSGLAHDTELKASHPVRVRARGVQHATYCTPAMIQAFAQGIANGYDPNTVAQQLGISRSTYAYWMKRGAPTLGEDGEWVYPNSVFGDFVREVEAAKAQAEVLMVDYIRDAAKLDWRAAEAWLKANRPDVWGNKRQEVRVTVQSEEIEAAKEELFGSLEGYTVDQADDSLPVSSIEDASRDAMS